MKQQLLSFAAAAALAATASAQWVTVNLGGAWTTTPYCQQTINNFNSNNGMGAIVFGGCTAEFGTTLSPGCALRATATVQAQNTGTGSHTDGSSATAGGIEFYFHPTGGNATCTLTATPEPAVKNLRGQGISGKVTAAVAATCPFFGWLRATVIVNAVAGVPPLATVPVTASGSGSGLTQFSVNGSAGSTATGTLTLLGDAMQLFAGAHVTGVVTLF